MLERVIIVFHISFILMLFVTSINVLSISLSLKPAIVATQECGSNADVSRKNDWLNEKNFSVQKLKIRISASRNRTELCYTLQETQQQKNS